MAGGASSSVTQLVKIFDMSKEKDQQRFEKQQHRNLNSIAARIDRLFRRATRKSAALATKVKEIGDEPFSFADHPQLEKEMNDIVQDLGRGVDAVIVNGISAAWTIANNKNSELTKTIVGDHYISTEQENRYYSSNDQARKAFLQRKEQGLNLSDRVWRYTDAFKNEIEMGLDIGIRTGESASFLATRLQRYLQHPNELFRRVRDQHGNLQLSKRAAEYHPGRGVYRSSYKNARRLAVTETNIAYHTADHLRWQQLDFVVGVQISLSGNHTIEGPDGTPQQFHDMCDELQGCYPKGFKFTGWHPHCRCRATAILKTEKEFMADTKAIINGGEVSTDSSQEVKDYPEAFKQWLSKNADRIEQASSVPYFIRDNAAAVKKALKAST
jgi:hypothetical protein